MIEEMTEKAAGVDRSDGVPTYRATLGYEVQAQHCGIAGGGHLVSCAGRDPQCRCPTEHPGRVAHADV